MALLPLHQIRTVGLAGAGEVGAGWAALLLARGYRVIACDPAPGAQERLLQGIAARWDALRRLNACDSDTPWLNLTFAGNLDEMARGSDLVQENAPENPAVKRDVIARIDSALAPDRLILSSSGGTQPSQLQSYCQFPERLVLGHPFNPAHLVPLVEVVGGARTSDEALQLALDFYRSLGKHPIHLKGEIVGHLSNRLQFALLREASHCLSAGIASAVDIDAAMRYGLGPRWALMGSLMTFNLAGGESGIAGLLERFGDDIERWWDALEPTRLTPEVRSALIDGAEQLRDGRSNAEWAQWRDDALINFFEFTARHPFPGQDGAPSELNSTVMNRKVEP